MERALKKYLPKGRFDNIGTVRSRTMAAIRGKGNRTTEVTFRMVLVRCKIRGWSMHKNLPGRPDFYFKQKKLAVFLDGCFWHGCNRCGHTPKTRSEFWRVKIARNKARDRKTAIILREIGVSVIRAWEHQLKSPVQIDRLLSKIKRLLERKN